jgi:RNA polymerase sigma-70 factor (ECF subfamily)
VDAADAAGAEDTVGEDTVGDAAEGAGEDEVGVERQSLDALHARLLKGERRDPVASSELAGVILEPLRRRLAWRAGNLLRAMGPTVRDDALNDATVTAYMNYVRRPEQYDPRKARGGLLPFLTMAAHRDLLNALPTIERHRNVVPLSLVEQRGEDRNSPLTPVGAVSGAERGTNPEDVVDAHERAAEGDARMRAQLRLMESDAERGVLRHMLAGERDTATFAADLGLSGLAADAQRHEVKRVKDKIKKRLERAGFSAAAGKSDGPRARRGTRRAGGRDESDG